MGFNCLKAKATSRRQFTFYHSVPRNFWYLFHRPRKDERLSRPWSHPMVLNTGPLDWESSALTTRPLIRQDVKLLKLVDFLHIYIILVIFQQNGCKDLSLWLSLSAIIEEIYPDNRKSSSLPQKNVMRRIKNLWQYYKRRWGNLVHFSGTCPAIFSTIVWNLKKKKKKKNE